ncbi:MAG: rRNA cytosine-C5-methyltransferase [Bacteroidales bacterium]|nr:rRNA cytosine-C5-methyltransferase [Bacteroidales bacterium]
MTDFFPKDFTERVAGQEYIDESSLFAALTDPSPVSIRLNPAKWGRAPLSGERVPWCDTGFYLPRRPVFTLDPLLHAGCYYVQEASSMFLEVVFRQLCGEGNGLRILDMSASPGGKTTHLASLAGPDSILIANEPVRSRLGALLENTTRWGKPNTIVSNSDPDDFIRLPDFFDIILVDAPCSGEGMFRKTDVRELWSVSNCDICSDRQKRILRAAWQTLKPGGSLIYSTCTFNPDENEANIRWLIESYGAGVVRVDKSRFEGVKELGDTEILGYGFHPGNIRGEGFFISAVTKPETTEVKEYVMVPYARAPGKHSLQGKAIPQKIADMVTLSGGYLHQSGDSFYHYPVSADEMALIGGKLNLVKRGTEICRLKRDSIIPSHELCMSAIMTANTFPEVDVSYNDAIRFLRKDNLVLKEGIPAGWCVLTYAGVRLGFVNNIGSRLNNYFPANSRIRMDAATDEVRVLI